LDKESQQFEELWIGYERTKLVYLGREWYPPVFKVDDFLRDFFRLWSESAVGRCPISARKYKQRRIVATKTKNIFS